MLLNAKRKLEIFNVGIIGASIAGGALANHLGKLGYSAIIFDKENFPREKSCGEGLSNQGIKLLQEIGVENIFQKLNGYSINKEINNQQKQINIKHQFGFGCRRVILDNLIIKNLDRYSCIKTEFNSEILWIKNKFQYWFIKYRSKTDSVCKIIGVKYLLLAVGSNSNIYSKLISKTRNSTEISSIANLPNLQSKQELRINSKHNRYGLSTTITTLQKHNLSEVKIFLENNFQLIFTPVGGKEINISMLITQNKFIDNNLILNKIKKNNLENLIKKYLNKINLDSHIQLEIINMSAILGRTIPIKNSFNFKMGNKLYILGDALCTLDPIGGMGMTQALVQAKILAVYLDRFIKGKISENTYSRKVARILNIKYIKYSLFTNLNYYFIVQKSEIFFLFPRISQFFTTLISKIIHGKF